MAPLLVVGIVVILLLVAAVQHPRHDASPADRFVQAPPVDLRFLQAIEPSRTVDLRPVHGDACLGARMRRAGHREARAMAIAALAGQQISRPTTPLGSVGAGQPRVRG